MSKMKSKLMLAGVLVACAFGEMALSLAWANGNGATKTTQSVVDFATKSIVRGESTLTRTDNGITMHLTATGVEPGAYTGWIPIFGPSGPIVAGRVAGHVVGEGGELTFTAHLKEGEIISGHPMIPSGSLTDARGQDIGMVVRYHGPADPGRIYEQTHTFEPGVATDFLFTRHDAP
ncbi:MAG: hypothetical protein WD894_21150 [Pirellulales bacterium]